MQRLSVNKLRKALADDGWWVGSFNCHDGRRYLVSDETGRGRPGLHMGIRADRETFREWAAVQLQAYVN